MSTQTPLAEQKWQVVSIGYDGKETPIPASYDVYLHFKQNGEFGGNDPVNYHFGTYRITPGGFTISSLATTLKSYVGKDQIVRLAVSAITAFDSGVQATAVVTENRMKIMVNGYLLDCQPSRS